MLPLNESASPNGIKLEKNAKHIVSVDFTSFPALIFGEFDACTK